ncbi:MAG TPA: CopD family protein [Dehalococcoidia bacterium]|jgi:copper transport protein
MTNTASVRSLARRPTVLAVILLLAALAWSQAPRSAEAHAALVRSDPSVNARLSDSPTVVTAFYSESLDSQLSSMKVLDGEGKRVDSGQVTFGPDPAQMSVAVEKLGPAFYAVQWETLSGVDGHLLKGSIPFTVLNPDGTDPAGPHPSAEVASGFTISSVKPEDVVTKWINLLGAVLLVGGLGFALAVAGPASRGLLAPLKEEALSARRRHLAWAVWPGLLLLAITGVAELLLQAHKLGGLSALGDVLRSSWGEHWLQRQLLLAGMLVAFGVFQVRSARAGVLGEAALWATLAGGGSYLLIVAMVSHGAAISGSFWAIAVDFGHLLASAVWVGMLVQLALFLVWVRRRPSVEERDELMVGHLRRFSPFAATSVVILLASGSVNALSQLPDLSAIVDTVYGQVLIIKLSLMMALLLVAAVNAFYLRPRLTARVASVAEPASASRARALLWRMVRIEIGLAIGVLLVAAALVQYPTARQQRAAEANVTTSNEAAGFNAVQPAGNIDVQLSVSPNQVGTNAFLLYLFPPSNGEPENVSRVRFRFQSPDPSLGPALIVADASGENSYKAVGPFLTEPGTWQVQVELRRIQVDDVSTVFQVAVTGIGPAQKLDRFALPLEIGSWIAVAAAGAFLGVILVVIWVMQWPGRSRSPRRPSG